MKNKLFSIFTALAMVLGILVSPFTSAHAADGAKDEVTEKVTLHKLIMNKTDLKNWDSDKIQEAGYDGSQNTDQLKALLKEGHSATEVSGVYFAVKNSKDKFVTIKSDTKKEEKPTYGEADSLDAKLPDGYELLAGETTANGIEFNTKGLKGVYTIEEIHEKSSYYNNSKDEKENGKIITDSKAVPVEITLPLVNNKGVVKEAHVYPKNTEDKPQIDKNFLKENELTAAEQEAADKLKVGADYKNYQEKKATAKAEIGKNVPYEVKTEIPAKSNLKEAHWDDIMTEGLTYNKDLKVKIGGNEITPTEDELVQTDKGFSLKLKGDNLALLNGKDAPVTVELKYSATVNSKAIVDIPEANDITFHYGNTPSKGNTPKPTKPNDNGEIKVEKTWDEGSKFVDGEWAKFKLVDANTGEDVKSTDLVNAPDDYKFEGTVTLSKGTTENYTWKYLNKDKQYKVVEVESKTLSDAEYTEAKDGTIKVTNHKSNNPKPLNPTEPKVVNGGKKFVKTNQEGTERLVGAQFIVLDSKGENYLVAKSSTEENAANVNVTDAKTELDDAVKAYNGLNADEQKGQKGTAAKDRIDNAQQAYNKAVKDAAKAYKWEKLPTTLKDKEAPEGAVVLTSDSEGKFEITGLEYGDYKLKEITPPSGFAKLNGNVDFTVAKGSYAGDSTKEFKYEVTVDASKGEKQTYGQQVKNKKVSIPQTGGIGSLIFVVAGLAIMAGAYAAYRKNQARA